MWARCWSVPARVRQGGGMMRDLDIARWRLRSQHLVSPFAASAFEAVGSLLAVQAENLSQAAWAVASRTPNPDQADLAALLDDGAVLRTHVLRPTWHFVRAEDIGWLLDLTGPRVRRVTGQQLQTTHGLDLRAIERAVAGVTQALASRGQLTRGQHHRRSPDHSAHPTGPHATPRAEPPRAEPPRAEPWIPHPDPGAGAGHLAPAHPAQPHRRNVLPTVAAADHRRQRRRVRRPPQPGRRLPPLPQRNPPPGHREYAELGHRPTAEPARRARNLSPAGRRRTRSHLPGRNRILHTRRLHH